jgi:PAS domain-containing protein
MLADGNSIFAVKHSVGTFQLWIIQTKSNALLQWKTLATLTTTLAATTSFVVLVLGFAFHWQSTRAREADKAYEEVANRIDIALNSGRIGLWSWDFERGSLFWSRSMFTLLGLSSESDSLGEDGLSNLIHPSDENILDIFRHAVAGKQNQKINLLFRMRHKWRGWISILLRGEFIYDRTLQRPYFVGAGTEVADQGQNLSPNFLSSDHAELSLESPFDRPSDIPIHWKGRVSLARASVHHTVEATPTYPKYLINTFSVGVLSSALGLSVIAAGIIVKTFVAQYVGCGVLMFGILTVTVAVLEGQSVAEQHQK